MNIDVGTLHICYVGSRWPLDMRWTQSDLPVIGAAVNCVPSCASPRCRLLVIIGPISEAGGACRLTCLSIFARTSAVGPQVQDVTQELENNSAVFKLHYSELIAKDEEIKRLKAVIEGLSFGRQTA